VARLTRKELKSDKFVSEVGHTVEYVSEHRRQVIRYAIVGAVVLVLVLLFFGYRSQQRTARQSAMKAAEEIPKSPVGPPRPDSPKTYATDQERDSAAAKAFSDLVAKYPGSNEAIEAEYYLGVGAAGQNKLLEAEKWLKDVSDSGNANYASLAKLVLADLYRSQGKLAEAEKLLRALMAQPSDFVSKDVATVTLAQLLVSTRPQEARKLVEPLMATNRPAIGRAAAAVMGELQGKP
jgi:predicted negative regulator of RcsB-dependent stress response